MDKVFKTKSGKYTADYDYILGQPGVRLVDDKLILECSSAGDKQFSPFYAEVTVYGEKNTIEYFFQASKGFYDYDYDGFPKLGSDGRPVILQHTADFMKAKGLRPDVLALRGLQLDIQFHPQWYKLLWVKYLDNNPDLVEYLRNFDDYNDCFSHGSPVNQASVIRQYIQEGREAIIEECKMFYHILEQQNRIDRQYDEEKEWNMDTHL